MQNEKKRSWFYDLAETVTLGMMSLIMSGPSKRSASSAHERKIAQRQQDSINFMYREYCDHTPESERKSRLSWFFTETKKLWLEEKKTSPIFVGGFQVAAFSLLMFFMSELLGALPIPYFGIVSHLFGAGALIWSVFAFMDVKELRVLFILLNPFLYGILVFMFT